MGRQFRRAADVQCYNCRRIGHLARVCRAARKSNSGIRRIQFDDRKQNWNAGSQPGFFPGGAHKIPGTTG